MELRDYLKVIRARWWLMVLSTLVVLVASLAFILLQAPSYQGEAQVIVSEQNTGALLLGAPQNTALGQANQAEVQTQAQVIQSRRIAEQVIRTLGLKTTADSLLKRVKAITDGETNIVAIDVTDGSAARSAQIANAFAQAYVAWSLESQLASIKAAGDDVERRLAVAQQQIVALTPANGVARGDKLVKLNAATTRYASLAANLEQLRINQQLETGSGSILTSAVADPSPVSPKPVRDGALALVLGLALGLAVVFLAEQLDSRIRSSAEAEEIYGAPALGSIPIETFKDKDASRLTLVQHPGSPAAEAYRGLRTSLDFINIEHDIKTVLVTSAGPSEGKSTVAANLATALSQAGKKVVLLNCDFHRPSMAAFFDLDNHIGLSDVLTGAQQMSAALQQPEGLSRLRVVTAGRVPPNPSGLLGSSSMERLLAHVRETVDWIIVDTPPVLAVADTAALARLVDGVLMVTRIGVSTRDAARATRDQLENVGGRILGVVAWGIGHEATGVGYASYYTSYSHDTSG